jgi:hypothetical protein
MSNKNVKSVTTANANAVTPKNAELHAAMLRIREANKRAEDAKAEAKAAKEKAALLVKEANEAAEKDAKAFAEAKSVIRAQAFDATREFFDVATIGEKRAFLREMLGGSADRKPRVACSECGSKGRHTNACSKSKASKAA